ncbi:DUF4252 domain-containing protein [Congregibacter sp.]|uniref:DUF4252 domain-containing protein n=1 Tax=Congregibacter sp. TaxID=2744308 RepID=UPI00385FB945
MRTLAVVTLTVMLAGCGLTASSENPGYVQFETPEHTGLKHGTSISLGASVLRFAAKHTDNDPQARALMESLDGIQISVHKMSEDVDYQALDMDIGLATENAFDNDWNPIVRVVEDDSRVHVFVKEHDGMLQGLAIVAVDQEELVFINMMGEIAPDNLRSWSSVVPRSESIALITDSID